jgi:hypothetical protein
MTVLAKKIAGAGTGTGTKRWIVPGSLRICPKTCRGYAIRTAKVDIVDAENGIARRECRECGAVEEIELRKYKMRLPCEKCHDVRDVTVSMWTIVGKLEKHWRGKCAICELEASAQHHQNQATIFFARVAKLRAARRKKKEEKLGKLSSVAKDNT